AGAVYVDHAGAGLYPVSVPRRFADDLAGNLYGNPHSNNPAAMRTAHAVDSIRQQVLRSIFDVTDNATLSEYSVIFVANATAGFKLVSEVLPWLNLDGEGDAGRFVYMRESHTSVVGMRAVALANGAKSASETCDSTVEAYLRGDSNEFDGPCVFAYPAQCNFSGNRFPLTWPVQLRSRNPSIVTVLDAAGMVSTDRLSLADPSTAPDFTIVSFYKIFGFPTGLGAVVVRHACPLIQSDRINKTYFGGGTVTAVAHDAPWQFFRKSLPARFEDGTINFLDIIALGHSIEARDTVFGGILHIASHVKAVRKYAINQLSSIKHPNGLNAVVFHCETDSSADSGPIINFSLQREDGSPIGYAEVERLASLHNIHLRAGGHCNPGAMSRWLGITSEFTAKHHQAGHICGDDVDFVDGKQTGSVRISFGASSSYEDVEAVVGLITAFFVNVASTPEAIQSSSSIKQQSQQYEVERVVIYPIKSCAGQDVSTNENGWPVTSTGLLHLDREWMLVAAETGQYLSMKRYPAMTLIQPTIVFSPNSTPHTLPQPLELHVDAPGMPHLVVDIANSETALTGTRVCGDSIDVDRYTDGTIHDWFSEFLGVSCMLVRQRPQSRECRLNEQRSSSSESKVTAAETTTATATATATTAVAACPISLSLANEAPMLLVNKDSADQVNSWIHSKDYDSGIDNINDTKVSIDAYRANLIVKSTSSISSASSTAQPQPFVEDTWQTITLVRGTSRLDITVLGQCRRCNMICVDPTTATVSREPYATLAKHRRVNNRVVFGVHVAVADSSLS
ncbi:PLP-dependent transferase, partial [Ramicandelaber brevisporus]